MKFAIGDAVRCPGRGIGTIERVRGTVGLCRVRFTRNTVCWIDDESLELVAKSEVRA